MKQLLPSFHLLPTTNKAPQPAFQTLHITLFTQLIHLLYCKFAR